MRNTSSILSSSIGNILEWYDFGLFTIFSSLFSQLFFPSEDPKVAMLTTFGIFAIGFFCRPIGALIFGYLGDKTGRARTLRLSILMISLPTLLIGLLPTYAQIGIAAPICLTVIRMWQGISIGGEYSGSLIYLAETAPRNYRATITSFASMGANLGILLAALVGIITTATFSKTALHSWGWRMPYLLSGILSLIIYIFRLHIKETHIFDYLKQKRLLTQNPIKTVFRDNLSELFRTLGIVCMGTTFYYFCFIFIPLYLEHFLQLSINTISLLITSSILLMIILVPFAGLLCDKLGRRKMLLFNATFVTLIVIPGFYLLHIEYLMILMAVLAIFTIASALEQGTTSIAVVENFPPPARYTGVSLGYNIGNGFLGGTVPIVCEWIMTKTAYPLAPAFYISSFAIITGLVVYFFVPETERKSLLR